MAPLSRNPAHWFMVWLLSAAAAVASTTIAADPMPSWRDSASKNAITAFVDEITEPGSKRYVPERQRIAVFDNDGTLWGEQPVYFQLLFVLDRVRAMAPQHPEWKKEEPFASVLRGDMKGVLAGGEESLLKLVLATHSGQTTDEFEAEVQEWMATARHPDSGRPFTEMVYQPMLELLDYLRANGIQTYIVSGGGAAFMRPWVEDVYGIPPNQVVGSRVEAEFTMRDGEPVVMRKPGIDFIDDKAGKPVGIYQGIGQRPMMAFGNSDGDLQMLQWTMAGEGPRFAALVHHTDGEREVAYDRESHIGKLDKALAIARKDGWTLIDMRGDWEVIFPAQD